MKKLASEILMADMAVPKGLDFVLVEPPARLMPTMMPSGIGYLHNALKNTGISHKTLDFNLLLHHLFHERRQAAGACGGQYGAALGRDPWELESAGLWWLDSTRDFFRKDYDFFVDMIARAAPASIGLSVNAVNRKAAEYFISSFRRLLPGSRIIVGGHSCVSRTDAAAQVADFDHMCVYDSELTLPALLKELKRSPEPPRDLPGVISRFDSPGREWKDGPLPMDLDAVRFPTYDWVSDINLYRDHKGLVFVPVTPTRGCAWGRCRFCRECLPLRVREPEKVLEELEWFVARGMSSFLFNDSDINNDPVRLERLCGLISSSGLRLTFSGQLRVDRRSGPGFFASLKKAGCVTLRFGVDAWSANTLRLQRKGYSVDVIRRNLRDAHNAGIQTCVNILVGVPGETEADIDESLSNLTGLKDCIDAVSFLHPLELVPDSEYYRNPEAHGIVFLSPKEKLYRENPSAIPQLQWRSENPPIDFGVRLRRMKRIYTTLQSAGFEIDSAIKSRITNDAAQTGFSARTDDEAPDFVGFHPFSYNMVRLHDMFYALYETLPLSQAGVLVNDPGLLASKAVIPAGTMGELREKIEGADVDKALLLASCQGKEVRKPRRLADVFKRFLAMAEARGWGRIGVYGAGQHTFKLLDLVESEAGRGRVPVVAAIFDDAPPRPSMGGVLVHKTEKMGEIGGFDVILISSDVHEEVMFAKASGFGLGKSVVALYSGEVSEAGPSGADKEKSN